tara:strand:+ start:2361 stop:2582 length:222 start_codon:yes stop_codon:yes gene_type:complete
MSSSNSPQASSEIAIQADLKHLASLKADAQGDIDWSLIEANLKRSPEERIKSCQEAITQVSLLQTAMRQATHG